MFRSNVHVGVNNDNDTLVVVLLSLERKVSGSFLILYNRKCIIIAMATN